MANKKKMTPEECQRRRAACKGYVEKLQKDYKKLELDLKKLKKDLADPMLIWYKD
jgi:hypothetical protein